jgi:uncharacterized repeat protein (TIGR03803 family)
MKLRKLTASRSVLILFVAMMINSGSVLADGLYTDGVFTCLWDDNANYNFPLCGLTQGGNGLLYGTFSHSIKGSIFCITTNGTSFSSIEFSDLNYPYDGWDPHAALVLGRDTNFYGTTTGGGQYLNGTIFRMTQNGVLSTLYAFTGNSDNGAPSARLVQASNGEFYGTTPHYNTYGTVFRMTSQGVFTTLHQFGGGSDGSDPDAALVLGEDGNLYGITRVGGAHGKGTVFKITPQGTFTTMYAFAGGADGGNPIGGLAKNTNGVMYGTTYYGGDYTSVDPNGRGFGTVYTITTNGVFTTISSFNNTNGANPNTTLVIGKDGNVYGTTAGGVKNYGIGAGVVTIFGSVFQMSPSGQLSTLVSFDFVSGAGGVPNELMERKDGNLYGTTKMGDGGNIYRINIGSRPVITTTSLPAGSVGVPYSQSLIATGGASAYTWAIISGGLPHGVSFSQDGVLSGMPTMADTNVFSVRVTDSHGLFAEKEFNISIAPSSGGALAVNKMQMKVNFSKVFSDGCAASMTVSLGNDFRAVGKTIAITCAGALMTFVLDDKGKGMNYPSSCSMKCSSVTGQWTVKVKYSRGYWQDEWASYGLINDNIPKPGAIVNVPIVLLIDGRAFLGGERVGVYCHSI